MHANIGASIVSDIRIVSPKYWNIGQRKFYANCLTLVTTIFKHSFHPYSHNATQGFVQCTHSPHATYNVGMLNDNRKIDYRNRFSFSFSCLYYRLLKWVRVHWQQLGQKERLLALLIIKVKPLTSVDTSPVGLLLLWAVAWPPTGLPSRPTGRWVWLQMVRRRVLPSPPPPSRFQTFQMMLFTTRCCLPSSPLSEADWMFPWQVTDLASTCGRQAVCSVCMSSL